MNDQPLVTVNILSFNRRDELKNTLIKVFEQDYKNIEVIVVDNASSDGSADMVKAEFPSVQLIQMEKNIGIAGWNEGFKVAKGEYVLVLDDDAYPENRTILNGMDFMIRNEKVGVVAYNVLDTSRNLSQTSTYKAPYLDFIGCGALLRKGIFTKLNGFDPKIFVFAHELDYSIRMLNLGYHIEYLPHSIVVHRANKKNNDHPINNGFRFYHQSISYLILVDKYLPQKLTNRVRHKFLINRFIIAIYFKRIKEFVKILKYYFYIKKTVNHVKIDEKILKQFDFNVAFFDRLYFGGLIKTKSIVLLIFRYFQTFFYPIETKNKFIL